jgi:steroid 5-alpha reductase family enzyme
MYINRSSDRKLISLREEQTGYQIPLEGLFKYISCPNHFGELIEWSGFALIAWNLPALSFVLWTICNLIPRSLNHHEWYLSNFKDYPKNRKAIIPFIW